MANSSDNILQYMCTAVLRVEGSVLRVLLVGKSIYYVQTDVQTRSLCLELLSLVAIYCPQTFFSNKKLDFNITTSSLSFFLSVNFVLLRPHKFYSFILKIIS